MAALVSVSSYAIDLSKSAGLFSPMAFSALPGDFFDTAAKAYASLLDLQMYWLALLMPQAASQTPAHASPGQRRNRWRPAWMPPSELPRGASRSPVCARVAQSFGL